ncbi:hypothetical protein SCHPADRAFT_881025 [Schizopora paradoxa]|uniref:Uncharacterized protein n=1 Tax=Schizopora paradoxa TaxID=27342 RepID=A0A0H2RT11_9AGAM|nr:hypothetical protein SCHPADRAFT_881025 [Schizopora paradoxa]
MRTLRILSISFSIVYGICGTIMEGGNCTVSNNRIDATTHKFLSDCDDRTYCAPSHSNSSSPQLNRRDGNNTTTLVGGTCMKRLCRKDEFQYGFQPTEELPPLCDRGSFCPDEGSGCIPLRPSGSYCELERNYQCAAPPNWGKLSSDFNLNFNGSVCLQSKCLFANVTLGLPCVSEKTTYSGYSALTGSQQVNYTVANDNCKSAKVHLYCDSSSGVCERMKGLGVDCDNGRECLSTNCVSSRCVEPPGQPAKVKPWQYALTTLSVIASVVATCVFLTYSHKRARVEKYYEVMDYYNEQMSLRSSIIRLHSAAASRLAKEDDY